MVLITVHCPACRNCYKLKPELRGRNIYCPNCREAFTVPADEDGETTSDADPGARQEVIVRQNQSTGQVGEMVPLVAAEAVEPPATSSGPEAKLMDVASWRTAPPPVRQEPRDRPAPVENIPA